MSKSHLYAKKTGMKVVLSPEARTQVESLQAMHYRGTGIVTGHALGGWLIVEGIWPVPGSSPGVHHLLRRIHGSRQKGMLVANRRLRLNREMEEEVIVEICGRVVRYFICHWDDQAHRLLLETLVEEA